MTGKNSERRGSTGYLKLWKRKRERAGGMRRQEKIVRRRSSCSASKLTPRSSDKLGNKEEAAVSGLLMRWMKDFKGKWRRMEKSLDDIRKELGNMRKREEEWREERDRMGKRLEELEIKWDKREAEGEGGKRLEEIEERVEALEGGGEMGEANVMEVTRKLEEKMRAMERNGWRGNGK